MKVLIVEDDLRLAEALGHIIAQEGYLVDVVNDGEEGLYYASNNEYDVIILDVMLPKLNGYEVIRELRDQKNAVPTLMLTAKNEISDKVAGLDAGADDYMIKPFSSEELLARVRALSRRIGEVVVKKLEYSDLSLNIDTYKLEGNKKEIQLSAREFQVFHLLLASPDVIISKEDLINKVWGYDADINDNNVEAFISLLRKKLKYLNSKVSIKTIRRAGYKLEAE